MNKGIRCIVYLLLISNALYGEVAWDSGKNFYKNIGGEALEQEAKETGKLPLNDAKVADFQSKINKECIRIKGDAATDVKNAKNSQERRKALQIQNSVVDACRILSDASGRARYDKQKGFRDTGLQWNSSKNHYENIGGVQLFEEAKTLAGKPLENADMVRFQQKVNSRCSDIKNEALNNLKNQPSGSPERKDAQEFQNKVDSACSTLSNPKNRAGYDKNLFKNEEPKKIVDESDKVLDDVTLPSEQSDTFIQQLQLFLRKKVEGLAKDAPLLIFKLIGAELAKQEISPAAGKIFNADFALTDVKFIEVNSSNPEAVSLRGSGIRAGLGITGKTQFNQFAVKSTIFIVQTSDKKIAFSVGLELPDNYKISNLFPKFTQLDVLPIPQGKLVFSKFDYTDPDGYSVKTGLNFIGSLLLEGPLKALGELRAKAKTMKSIVFDFAAPIYLQGVIESMTAGSFRAVVPMRLGMDFASNPKIPKGFSSLFNKITTDDIIVEVKISPLEQKLGGQAGIQITLGTQPNPVRVQAFGGIEPLTGKINLGGKIPDMIEFNKWLAIGDLAFELYFDPAIVAILVAFGIPVSGIALQGRIDMGVQDGKRASLSVAGKLSLETKKALDFVLDVSARDIQFAKLVSLLTKMGGKSGIPADKLPVMNINSLKGKLAPQDTEIAGQKIPAGFQLALDATLFNQTFGFDVDIRHKDLTFKGLGYLSDITVKGPRGNVVVKISGPGPDKKYDTKDDGPIVACEFDAKNIAAGKFMIGAMFDVPALMIKDAIELEIGGGKFKANLESTKLGFTIVFGVNIDPKNIVDMYIRFGFKGDFGKYLSERAIPAIQDWQKEVVEKAAAIDKKIGELSVALQKLAVKREEAKKKFVGKADDEIVRVENTIKRIKKKIQNLKDECVALKKEGKAGWRLKCGKIGLEIGAQGTALAAQETYKETLLKGGKKLVTGTLDTAGKINEAFQDASEAIAEAEIFKKVLNGLLTGLTEALKGIAAGADIFKITEAIGEINANDLKAGKSPMLKSFIAEINIPGLPSQKITLKDKQIDFKKMGDSIKKFAKDIIDDVKKSFEKVKKAFKPKKKGVALPA